MNKISVDIFTDQGNNAIIKLPERKFPGLVIQGDSLSNLCDMANSAKEFLAAGNKEELADEIEGLAETLGDLLQQYENILQENGISLPYIKNND